MAYFNAAAQGVTIYSTSNKFCPVWNFAQLHALTLAARSYALLLHYIHNNVYLYTYNSCLQWRCLGNGFISGALVPRLCLDASVQDKTIPQRTDSHQEVRTLMAAYLCTKYADCLGS